MIAGKPLRDSADPSWSRRESVLHQPALQCFRLTFGLRATLCYLGLACSWPDALTFAELVLQFFQFLAHTGLGVEYKWG